MILYSRNVGRKIGYILFFDNIYYTSKPYWIWFYLGEYYKKNKIFKYLFSNKKILLINYDNYDKKKELKKVSEHYENVESKDLAQSIIQIICSNYKKIKKDNFKNNLNKIKKRNSSIYSLFQSFNSDLQNEIYCSISNDIYIKECINSLQIIPDINSSYNFKLNKDEIVLIQKNIKILLYKKTEEEINNFDVFKEGRIVSFLENIEVISDSFYWAIKNNIDDFKMKVKKNLK